MKFESAKQKVSQDSKGPIDTVFIRLIPDRRKHEGPVACEGTHRLQDFSCT